jgi:hypothetical protein
MKPSLRPLTEEELDGLQRCLGRPVDRSYLKHWLSTAIADVVRLSVLPSPREVRTDLTRMAREGRQWLRHINECSELFSPRMQSELEDLARTTEAFCQSADAMAGDLAKSVKAGRPQTPFALRAFLGRLIGIAKRARVLPRTPSRQHTEKESTLPFFQFISNALGVAENVIETSSVPRTHKIAALRVLTSHNREALIKVLEELRGRISDYHESEHGLVQRE